MNKKKVRDAFRNAVFKRDGHKCVMCGKTGQLDAHHITDRNLMPNGGYVKENGITLCSSGDDHELYYKRSCHWKAEQFHIHDEAYPGYSPEELYQKIGSSFELARKSSEDLC